MQSFTTNIVKSPMGLFISAEYDTNEEAHLAFSLQSELHVNLIKYSLFQKIRIYFSVIYTNATFYIRKNKSYVWAYQYFIANICM